MFAKVSSFGLSGINAFLVDVEVDIRKGSPYFDVGGLPDTAVKESRERIRSALYACGIQFPVASVMVNLAPAGTKKSGSVHDMAIFMAVLCASNLVDEVPTDCAFIGELSLNGDIRGINGVLSMVILAREKNIHSVFVPYENAREASVIDGINVYAVKNVNELIEHFRHQKMLTPCERYIPSDTEYIETLDFSDVIGQQSAKKALEISVAGGHNVMLIGNPGCGKSMLAKRIPSILPPLEFEESLETTKIHSVMGLVTPEMPIITKRPFRSPHHTTSEAGIIGGGTVPHPGEISLAHNGVLFFDEMAEFDRRTLECLRQPLEDGTVTVSRVNGRFTYPCDVIFVGAMNPCPCGYYGSTQRECKCSAKKITAYRSKLSGPLIDRIDLQIEVASLDFHEMSSDSFSESSADIRKRVIRARQIQKERFRGTSIKCNALMTKKAINEYCKIGDDSRDYLEKVFNSLGFSTRSYDSILKVSRTIADLDECENIQKKHISTAVRYKNLDRNPL
ncbi:MAG: YifB family Mg chelatase-like AAA ATPase [Ruminococcus flavefaciens]|nr:YifB family Mg chelatase-like AAA ATPase [Ruminococcus flavefaciens]